MVGGNESMVIAYMWASIAAWFTPSLLFCAANLIIATIFIASKNNNKHHHHVHDYSFSRIARVSSFFDRSRSMNLSSSTTTTVESQHHYHPSDSKTANYSSSSRLAQSIHFSSDYVTPPSQLACAPSLLERVKSIKLSSIYSENTFPTELGQNTNSPGKLVRVPSFFDRVKSFRISTAFKPEAPYTQPENVDTDSHYSENTFPNEFKQNANSPGQLVRVPPFFDRVKSFRISSAFKPEAPYTQPENVDTDSDYSENTFPTEFKQNANSPGQLVPVPSFFDRVKSFRISSAFKSEAPYTQPENVDRDTDQYSEHHVIRSKSEKQSAKKLSVEMKKSRSDMRISPDGEEDVDLRRPETARERRNDVDEEVDAKADDFIGRFKQQLKLQRLESLVRYNEMLKRRS